MRIRMLLGVLSVTSMFLFGMIPAQAQDASPPSGRLVPPSLRASPVAAGRSALPSCDAPELPPGTPTPMEATPAGETDTMDMGTPETAGAEASPSSPMPAGTSADDATTDEVLAWVHNYAICVNVEHTEAVFALLTDQFLLTRFGTTNVHDVMALAEFGPMTIESASDVQTHADGHLSVDLVYTGLYGPPTQLTHDRWFLIEDDGYLKLDASENLSR
jgi:hypothetical protein